MTTTPRVAPQIDGPRATSLTTAIASEWTKLWSVRSTWWSLVGGLLLMLLLALSMGFDAAQPPVDATREEAMLAVQDAAALGIVLAQFALVALATITVTSEFATGSMLATLQWEPRRGRVLAAKLAVIAPVVLFSATTMMLLAATVADLTAGDYGSFVLSDVLETAVRTGIYVTLAAILSAGIGVILRSTAGTLTVVFLVLMLLPMMLAPLNVPVVSTIGQYLPGSGGMHFASSSQMIGLGDLPYSEPAGLLILLAWTVAVVGAGHLTLARRDI